MKKKSSKKATPQYRTALHLHAARLNDANEAVFREFLAANGLSAQAFFLVALGSFVPGFDELNGKGVKRPPLLEC